jgi:2'-5' RNA ligase
MANRIFYVLYVQDRKIRTLLNSIRLICNPREKLESHITVRGPYHRRLSRIKQYNEKIRGSFVHVTGTGTFESSRQSTVYLHCRASFLAKFWCKPDYTEFQPHLTIYDGSSHEFAMALRRVLNSYDLHFSFEVTGLEPLFTTKGQNSADVWMNLDDSVCYALFRRRLVREDVIGMAERDRLALVDTLLRTAERQGLFRQAGQRTLSAEFA